MKKVYYIANLRMPSEKAYGIQMAKMCEALIAEGVDLTLVVPHRGSGGSLRKFYSLSLEVPTVWLPAIEFHRYERLGYLFMSVSFSISYILFLWWKKFCGERFILYTVDADRYSSSALSLVPVPIFSEMHGAKPRTFGPRVLFARVCGVIAINKIIVEELKRTFPRAKARYIVEPNGVDLEMFKPRSKIETREVLGLPDVPTVLYSGRFFEWKGLEILAQSAALTPDVRWQIVGGTKEEFASVAKVTIPDNMHFAGGRPYQEMPLWIAASDAVVVLGTKRDEQSYRWTSPMKLFEFLAAGRPIVAGDTPAIREIVSEHEALLYEPDNAQDLAQKVQEAIVGGHKIESMISAAGQSAKGRAWRGRAARVAHFIESQLYEQY